MSVHTDFILTSIASVLKDGVCACRGISGSIDNIAVCDYIMQSLFLRMTGFQEQKLKCICWDLATDDYEYRYKRFAQKTLGECSCYDEKNIVMNDLISIIRKYNPDFDVEVSVDKSLLKQSVLDSIESVFNDSVLKIWAEHQYHDFIKVYSTIQPNCFLKNSEKLCSLFCKCDNCNMMDRRTKLRLCGNIQNLNYIFDQLYKHRNRCAHNTSSYQQNLPTLKSLSMPEYIYENYFVRFSVLMLIDAIFVLLYKEYLDCVNK
jgi:hypothetical protein